MYIYIYFYFLLFTLNINKQKIFVHHIYCISENYNNLKLVFKKPEYVTSLTTTLSVIFFSAICIRLYFYSASPPFFVYSDDRWLIIKQVMNLE